MSEREEQQFLESIGVKVLLDHSRCHHGGYCRKYVVCPTCYQHTHVMSVMGRWDPTRNDGKGATALPFEPVAVRFGCLHYAGDVEASKPKPEQEREKDV